MALFSSCSNYQAQSFASNVSDVFKAQESIKNSMSVDIASSNSNKSSISCRGINRAIYLPNKENFTQYIKNALVETLINANLYNKTASNKILLDMKIIDFTTVSGKWHLKANVMINNNKPITVDGKYLFASAWDNDLACSNAAQAFDHAVTAFIHDILENTTIKSQLNN